MTESTNNDSIKLFGTKNRSQGLANENNPKVQKINNDSIIHSEIPELKELRLKNINRLIIGNLNINSIPNKFDQLKIIIKDKVDILLITETKLDSSFPENQFLIPGFSKPFRKDRNRHGGGLLLYVREDIPAKELSRHTFSNDIEGMFIEVNLRKTKWLILGTYHPPNQNDEYFFQNVRNSLDTYCQ